jgi:zona occludens toxin
MINLLLGAPGGGKSYEAVSFHVLPAVQRGRKVITNLPLNLEAFEALEPGSSALIELRTTTLADAPDTSENEGSEGSDGLMRLITRARASKFVNRAFANPEDYASEWRGVDGIGPLYVVDECHFCLPKMGTSKAVEEWFSMHRHFNADVLLITQSSGKISPSIRDLIQVCYKVRKAVALGKTDEYIRKIFDGVNGGEVSTTIRKYKPQYFKLYRSHTHGAALDEQSADDVAPFLVKFNRFKWFVVVLAFIACLYAFWPKEKPKPVVPAWLPSAVQEYKANPPTGPDFRTPSPPAGFASAPVVEAPPDLEPFRGQGIHITGWAKMGGRIIHTFAVSSGAYRLFPVTHSELLKSGYTFAPMGECAGVLTWGQKVRTVICDAPVISSGQNNAPVVIDAQTGQKSRDS